MMNLRELPEFKSLDLNYAIEPMTGTYVKAVALTYAEYLAKENKPFALFFIDVDNFKAINDSVGHQMGDKIMEKVANTILDVIGDNGIVGRFGGDEFIAIYQGDMAYENIWNTAEKMEKETKTIQFKSDTDFGIHQIVTLTMGVTRFPLDSSSVSELIEKADKALYRGKSKGRNCFVIYNPQLHGNLEIGKNATLDVYKIMDFMYSEFIASKEDYTKAILKISKFLYHLFHLGAVFIHCDKGFHTIINEGAILDAKEIPLSLYEKTGFKKNSLFVMNFRYPLTDQCPELIEKFMEQDIRSEIIAKIECNGKYYGYLRFDINHERVWSKDEILILQTLAKLTGFVLSIKK